MWQRPKKFTFLQKEKGVFLLIDILFEAYNFQYRISKLPYLGMIWDIMLCIVNDVICCN